MSNLENPQSEVKEPLHPSINEANEPTCSDAPIPSWLVLLICLVLFIAGMYLGLFNGGFRGDVYNERESSSALLFPEIKIAGGTEAAATAPDAVVESPVVRGKKFYTNPPASCVTCHQANGKGVPGSFPPLAGSEFVQGGSKRLGMILLKGLQGPLKVESATFNGAMPTWEKVLSDKQIASILTYVRQEWGNKAGEITPEQIAAARNEFRSRNEPWTEADVLAIPADAELPGGISATAAPDVKK